MGIMKSLCSVATSARIVSLLCHCQAKACESSLVKLLLKGWIFFSIKKGRVK